MQSVTSNSSSAAAERIVNAPNSELNEDDAVANALHVLLDVDTARLLSDELRETVRKVQQCVSHECGTVHAPARRGQFKASFDITTADSASQSAKNKRTEHVTKSPLVGATAYIISGPCAGLSGKVSSDRRNWYLIDNPALIGKSVKWTSCKLVDDGNMDVAAVTLFCAQRKRCLSIVKPGELDKSDERTKCRPRVKEEIVGRNDPVEETHTKQRRANKEVDNLKNFLHGPFDGKLTSHDSHCKAGVLHVQRRTSSVLANMIASSRDPSRLRLSPRWRLLPCLYFLTSDCLGICAICDCGPSCGTCSCYCRLCRASPRHHCFCCGVCLHV